MTDVITSLLPFAIVLVILVVVHELGHFITAKLSGVKVLEFGIGYPPRLFAIKRGETEYSINMLPLGGFVRLLGEENPEDPRSLAAQPAWRRLTVMGAGSFMNLVMAIALFTVALMIPREVPAGRAVIVQVVPDSPAEAAGLEAGDIILAIDGRDIPSTRDASYNIRLHLGEEIPIVVRRPDALSDSSTTETVQVKPRWAPPPYVYEVQPGDDVDTAAAATGYGRGAVRAAAAIKTAVPVGTVLSIADGVETIAYTWEAIDTVESVARRLLVDAAAVASAAGLPDQDALSPGTELQFTQGATGIQIASQYTFTETRSLGPWAALKGGWRSTADSFKLLRNEVYSWIKGSSSPNVSGPIGIAQVTGEVFREAGWKRMMDLGAVLSVNLAILNILPLPMLDGGRMAFVVLEVVRRGRRVAPAKEALVHYAGMVALLLLVLVLSYFDILRIVRGESLFR